MADLVRSTVEAMVPDLLGLMKRRIFTKREIKDILKTREGFEYTFLRKSSSKKDYLKAIQYEYELENQRRERFKKLKLKKQTQRDFTIIRRVIFIFDRLTAKYKYDVELWKEYCNFCYKIRANKMFFKAVSNALVVNWESLEIWLLAIYYHFDINKDPFKARRTFLKALKTNNKRKDFWLEYFRFELSFLQKIKQRKQISGVHEQAQTEEQEAVEMDREDDNDEMMMFDDDDKPAKKDSKTKANGFSSEDFIKLDDGDHKGGLKSDETDSLAAIVYDSIVEVFPEDKTINGELLQICDEFKGEWIEAIKAQISKGLMDKYVEDPLSNLHNFLDMVSLNQKSFENDDDEAIFSKVNSAVKEMILSFKALDVKQMEADHDVRKDKALIVQSFVEQIAVHYKHMIAVSNPRSKLFEEIFTVILKNVDLKDIEHSKTVQSRKEVDSVVVQIFSEIFQFTQTIEHISEESRGLAQYVFGLKNLDYKALEVLAEVAIKFSGQHVLVSEDLALRIRKYLKANKGIIPSQHQSALFSLLFKLEGVIDDKEKIIDFLKESIKFLCFSPGFPDFIQGYLRNVMDVYPVTEIVVSQCFTTLFGLRSSCPIAVSLLYIDKLSEIKASNPEIKKHLQKAVEWHPQSTELWLRYISFEKNHGNPLLCPDIFQKAQRQLKEGDFLHQYTGLMSS